MPVLTCNGADLYYEAHGEGPPIVFLHGMAAGLRYFEPQLTGLSDEYRTVAFDFRGQGRSAKTELVTPSPSTPATCAPFSNGWTSTR